MKPRHLWVTLGIVIGWGLGVVVAVRAGEQGLQLWRQKQEELRQSQEQLRRMLGWLETEQEITARWKEILGPLADVDSADWGWVALQGLQELVQAEGLGVEELRPSLVSGAVGRRPTVQLDAKLQGNLHQVSALLSRLPEKIPGVRLQSLQLLPKEGQTVQALIRIQLLSTSESRSAP